jgi:hypothetical protein
MVFIMLKTVRAVRATVRRVQITFAAGFILGCNQMSGNAKGGTQSNVMTMEPVLQYQGIVLSTGCCIG